MRAGTVTGVDTLERFAAACQDLPVRGTQAVTVSRDSAGFVVRAGLDHADDLRALVEAYGLTLHVVNATGWYAYPDGPADGPVVEILLGQVSADDAARTWARALLTLDTRLRDTVGVGLPPLVAWAQSGPAGDERREVLSSLGASLAELAIAAALEGPPGPAGPVEATLTTLLADGGQAGGSLRDAFGATPARRVLLRCDLIATARAL